MSKICFLIYDFTQTGGAERAAAKLMNELADARQITIISVFNKHAHGSYPLDDRIRMIRIIEGSGSIVRNLFKIVWNIRRIIHAGGFRYFISIDVATAFMGALGTFGKQLKFIVCDRSSVYNEDMYAKWLVRFYAWTGIHFCHKYQVMTKQGKAGCIRKYHINKNKIAVIPNWLDKEAIKDNEYHYDNHRILTVGRAATEKGYENLIEIAKRIKNQCPGWEWHIWGDFDNEYGRKLLKKLRDDGLDGFLIHKGVTQQIYEIYQNYSFYVMTSRFEGMPNVLLEAQGSKLPLVSYNCRTGPDEIIKDNVNGYLVEPGNTEEMCRKILSLVNDREKACTFSANSGIKLSGYSKEKIMKKWNALLR